MTNISEIRIPVAGKEFDLNEQDWPISPKENLMLALKRKKPMWMPNLHGDSQMAPPFKINANEPGEGYEYKDWFGVGYKFSEVQGSPTPVVPVLDNVLEWEKNFKWPDINDYALSTPDPSFVRNPGKLLGTRLPSNCFQMLHIVENFEQSLIDLITEPAACREFFEAMVDFGIKAFEEKDKAYKFDFVFYSDDWGTMRAPFFSVDLWKETILPPTKRWISFLKEYGMTVVFHCCGLVNEFIPFFAEEICPDGIDVQIINDIENHMRKYGEKLSIDLQRPDIALFFDPATSHETLRSKAREYVDRFGAHVMPGAGGIMAHGALDQERTNVFWDEIFAYSREKYSILNNK